MLKSSNRGKGEWRKRSSTLYFKSNFISISMAMCNNGLDCNSKGGRFSKTVQLQREIWVITRMFMNVEFISMRK